MSGQTAAKSGFLGLSEEKKKIIRDASLQIFGNRGYKKTSIRDIAERAGISKAAIFHYFGTKKELYLYLLEFCRSTLRSYAQDRDFSSGGDLFERMKQFLCINANALLQSPYLLGFIASAINERDTEIAPDIQEDYSLADTLSELILQDTDTACFKPGVDVRTVFQIIKWMAEGYLAELIFLPSSLSSARESSLINALDFLKKSLYRPEYL